MTTLSLKKKVTSHMTKNNPASNDKECFVARKKYQKSKRVYRKCGSIIFKEEVRESERKYKKVMDKSMKRYRKNYNDKNRQTYEQWPENILEKNKYKRT